MKIKKSHAARLAAFCKALSEKKLSGAVLDARNDSFYLTGFTGSDAVLVVTAKDGAPGKTLLVTDPRYTEEAAKTAPGAEILTWKDSFPAFVAALLKKEKLKRVAYTPHSMTAAFFDGLKSGADTVTDWTDAGPALAALRAVKSKEEITAIRAALDCAEQAFLRSREHWKTGMTEAEVKNDLEWEMKRLGAEGPSFETIVAAGANASLPHAHAGKKKVESGKMLLIDFGAIVGRYCSDLTRTVWPDEIPAVWAKRYGAVLEAQAAGIAAIRAGVKTDAPHAAAVEALRRHGLAEKFTHSLGHGIGLAVHEAPRLSAVRPRTLAAGNIVTCEPGVYFPGSGGIRVEEMVLVGKKGPEVLSTLPKRLEDALF